MNDNEKYQIIVCWFLIGVFCGWVLGSANKHATATTDMVGHTGMVASEALRDLAREFEAEGK